MIFTISGMQLHRVSLNAAQSSSKKLRYEKGLKGTPSA